MKKVLSAILSLSLILSLMICASATPYLANDTVTRAIEIKEGNTDITFTCQSAGDDDIARWYKFAPSATSFYTFKLSNTYYNNDESDTYMELYESFESAADEWDYYADAYLDQEGNEIGFNKALETNHTYYLVVHMSPSAKDAMTTRTMTLNIYPTAKHEHYISKYFNKSPIYDEIYTEYFPFFSESELREMLEGGYYYECSSCDYEKFDKTVEGIKTIKLSTKSYTYNGKVRKPSVIIKDFAGKTVPASNYIVSYAKGRKNVGKYAVTITFKGNSYEGSRHLSFTINPKTTSISKLSAKSKGFTVKWKKQATQTTGYQVQYSTNKKFKKGNKTVTVKGNKNTSKKISKLKGKKKYYVRVRTYKTVSKKNYYSSWSKVKSVTTKK